MSGTVTLALSELRSLVAKAARGAGLSWGLAEEAGWAAEWLARRGMPAADWATLWLAARVAGGPSPVEAGAALADEVLSGGAWEGRALPEGVAAPGFLLPFLHRIAEAKGPVAMVVGGALVASVARGGGVTLGPGWGAVSQGWSLTGGEAGDAPPGPATRPQVSASVIECLEGLALRTTVPASETSRKDAGSSDGDND